MQIASPTFWLVFALAVLVVWFRLRKGRVQPVGRRQRQLSITGQEIKSKIALGLPLGCLLDHGRFYGQGFQDKTPPTLPHGPGCTCKLAKYAKTGEEIFSGKSRDQIIHQSDLGALADKEARFYKFLLILQHPEMDPSQMADYLEVLARLEVDQSFQTRIEEHLGQKIPSLIQAAKARQAGGLEATPTHPPQGEEPSN